MPRPRWKPWALGSMIEKINAGEIHRMVLSDTQIAFRCRAGIPGMPQMIEPYCRESVREHTQSVNGAIERVRVISYGQSSYGYDARVAPEFKLFTNAKPLTVVDPKHFNKDCCVDFEGVELIMPPNSFALSRTVEWFRIPRDIIVICIGKSTYARCGIILNVTPLEPGWEGHVTIEISNTTPLPAKIYAGEGIVQMIFLMGNKQCKTSYADRDGKYQNQKGITLPSV